MPEESEPLFAAMMQSVERNREEADRQAAGELRADLERAIESPERLPPQERVYDRTDLGVEIERIAAQHAQDEQRRDEVEARERKEAEAKQREAEDARIEAKAGEVIAHAMHRHGLLPVDVNAVKVPAHLKVIVAKEACNWLINLMKESPDRSRPTARPKPVAKFFEDAKQRFPSLSKRGFDRAWAAACDATGCKWNLPGRKFEGKK